MSSSVVDARPAATVIVLRAQGSAFEVLLLRRHDQVAFMAGAHVFPGGRVDDHDHAAETASTDQWPRHFSDLSVGEEKTYRNAAVREVREEANVEILSSSLLPFAHWVTPSIEIRRFDTRFFLARMPQGQEARHDNHEMTAQAWLTPAEALDRARTGSILLPPPTWTTLRQLEPFSSIDAIWSWATTRPIVRVEPGFVKTDEVTMLTLPGDPLFPTIPGWVVPYETRFVLADNKGWIAQRV
jgi:8-oxo-dGTP pyrophosphatase MutT (NUDIX family)